MNMSSKHFKILTWLPVVLFSLVVKLLQHQKINDIRHVMVPLENEKVVKFMCFNVHLPSCTVYSIYIYTVYKCSL